MWVQRAIRLQPHPRGFHLITPTCSPPLPKISSGGAGSFPCVRRLVGQPDLLANAGRFLDDVEAADRGAPGAGLRQGGEDADCRRLAGAVVIEAGLTAR